MLQLFSIAKDIAEVVLRGLLRTGNQGSRQSLRGLYGQ